MATSTRVKLSYSGIGEMLRCHWMGTHIQKVADGVAKRAGESYEVTMHDTGQRIAADVRTRDKEAVQDNYDNNTLLKALK